MSVLAGGGLRGCNTGSSLTASFKQPKDLCVENDNTFFVVDPAAGCLLMITPTEGSVSFLQTLKKVYSAYHGIHLKHQRHTKLPDFDSAAKSIDEVSADLPRSRSS